MTCEDLVKSMAKRVRGFGTLALVWTWTVLNTLTDVLTSGSINFNINGSVLRYFERTLKTYLLHKLCTDYVLF